MPNTIPNLDLGSSGGSSAAEVEEEEEGVGSVCGGGSLDRSLREGGCEGIFRISE